MYIKKYNINYRKLIVGIDKKIPLSNGRLVTAINFDNAATTPPFVSVLKEIINFAPWYSSIHRGTGYKSQISSKFYENSRKVVADFVKADLKYDTVIYVKNTTEAINKLSNRLLDKNEKSTILSTDMEHHSNDLPWRGKYNVDYVKIDELGRLSIDDLKYKLDKYHKCGKDVKLVTVSGASNVTGIVNPIYEIAEIAHSYGAQILVDGAQLVPHVPMDMKPHDSPQHIDYLAFSAHKMYAPFGTGVLIGPQETFKKGSPDYSGGGTINVVTHDYVIWDTPPSKEEAGTPNVMGVVALVTSIKTLDALGMGNIQNYENSLTEYAIQELLTIPDIHIYGCTEPSQAKVGIISFNMADIPHNKLASILSSEAGIAVRDGCFCAQPYIHKLMNVSPQEIEKFAKDENAPRPGMVRISFGLYNTFEEIRVLIYILRKIVDNKHFYLKKLKSHN